MLLCLQPCFSLFLFSWASDKFKLSAGPHFLLSPWSCRLPSVFTICSECILFLVTQHPFHPFILSNTSSISFTGITSSPRGGLSLRSLGQQGVSTCTNIGKSDTLSLLSEFQTQWQRLENVGAHPLSTSTLTRLSGWSGALCWSQDEVLFLMCLSGSLWQSLNSLHTSLSLCVHFEHICSFP